MLKNSNLAAFLLSSLFLGHTWQYSGLNPGSAHGGPGTEPGWTALKINALPTALSLHLFSGLSSKLTVPSHFCFWVTQGLLPAPFSGVAPGLLRGTGGAGDQIGVGLI